MTDHRPGRRSALLTIGLVTLLGPMPAQAQPAAGTPPPAIASPVQPARPPEVEISGPARAPQGQTVPPAPETPQANDPSARRAIPAAAVGHELSPWSMFLNADILVKIIMSGLALASIVTWTILLAKTIELGLARRSLVRALARVDAAGSLGEAHRSLGAGGTVLDRLVETVVDEARRSRGYPEGIKERAVSRCSELVKAEGRIARRGMGALATIGAISPFVGLFGTVWGIMNSFIGISRSQTTNLAVVAPGIAEALLATAIGLAAAIPAVIIYNHFARATRSYGDLVQRASGTAMRLLSRDLEDRDTGRLVPLARAAE